MSTYSLTLSRPETSTPELQSLNDVSPATDRNARIMQLTRSLYQTDQQEKFLDLQAEVETLLQKLQSLKQEKLATGDEVLAQNQDDRSSAELNAL